LRKKGRSNGIELEKTQRKLVAERRGSGPEQRGREEAGGNHGPGLGRTGAGFLETKNEISSEWPVLQAATPGQTAHGTGENHFSALPVLRRGTRIYLKECGGYLRGKEFMWRAVPVRKREKKINPVQSGKGQI